MPQKMKRAAFNQPANRRPAWAKTEAMYKANISSSHSRSYGPRSDYGLDNFAYNKSHLVDFEIPNGIVAVLPTELRNAATTWVIAAAAINSSFDRIHKLDLDPISLSEASVTTSATTSFSEWPTCSPPLAPVDSVIDTPATSPPQSFDSSIVAPVAKYSYSHLPPNILGMDTPPFTPVDTRGPNTPADSTRVLNGTMPDPLTLDVQLGPLSSPPDTFSISSPIDTHDPESEKAWESYAKTYNAEVYDLKHVSFPRFAGLDRTVNKLLVELVEITGESSMSQERQIAMNAFRRWWRLHRGTVEKYRIRVDAVQERFLSES